MTRPEKPPERERTSKSPRKGLPPALASIEGAGGRQGRSFFTRALGDPPAAYGERIRWMGEAAWRPMEPSRTKLGAALCRGLSDVLLAPGMDVLYLGAATGTTASHVADIVGPTGTVYAVEKSPRAFMRLLSVSKRWPNLAPLLRDARAPKDYLGVVPMVGAIYADISQPDQASIVRENAALFLKEGGALLFAVKLSSMGRGRSEAEHVEDVRRELERTFRVREEISLEPFYRKHVLFTASLLGEARNPG